VPLELIATYYEFFGSKLICFADLLKYLPKRENGQGLISALRDVLERVKASDADKYYFEINYLKFHHLLIAEDAQNTKISIQQLHERYVASKALNTKLPTDF
jgi:N-acetyltransferase B complex (NatB) non catalytic subunit